MLGFIKKRWTDPVWSKVFATAITGAIAGVCTIAWILLKQIPIGEAYEYSSTHQVSFSYLTIFIISIVALLVAVFIIFAKAIKSKLKNLKFPSRFKTAKFDLQQFLLGGWHLKYVGQRNKGEELVTFVNGNQYFVGGNLAFVMTDIEFDSEKKELKWTKTRYPNSARYAREILTISENEMVGTDELGFQLTYSRIGK